MFSVCFDIFRIDTSSYSFKEDYELQKQSQERYYNMQLGINFTLKQLIKKFIPKKIIKIRQLINNSNNINEMNKLGQYCSNSGDNTYLRGILKKN